MKDDSPMGCRWLKISKSIRIRLSICRKTCPQWRPLAGINIVANTIKYHCNFIVAQLLVEVWVVLSIQTKGENTKFLNVWVFCQCIFVVKIRLYVNIFAKCFLTSLQKFFYPYIEEEFWIKFIWYSWRPGESEWYWSWHNF